jgi:hypothetical protein
MSEEIFADGISEITVTGPTVRIDLFSLSPAERDANNNPKPVLRQRLIMTLEGFMNARDLMDRVAGELIQAGTVRRRAPEAVQSATAEPASRRPQGSPNFP